MNIQPGEQHRPMLGGLARAATLTPEERKAIAQKARAQRTANYNAIHKSKKQTDKQK